MKTTIASFGNEFQISSFFDILVDIELTTNPPPTTRRGPLLFELEPVPEPASLALLVLPLAGLAALRWYRIAVAIFAGNGTTFRLMAGPAIRS